MAYIKPSVRVYQDFVTISAAIATPDLDALLVGPCYQFLDYTVPADKILADTSTDYTGAALTLLDYPSKTPGAVVKLDEAKVYIDDATLLFYSSPDLNAFTVTNAKPEQVVATGLNLATLQGRGILPGDTVILKKDATVGNEASLVNQGVTYEAKAKGTVGHSISITLTDPGAAQATTIFSVIGTAITVSLASDGTDIIATATSVVADYASAPAGVKNLISVSGTGASALTTMATASLAGGIDQVDGDTFETTVLQVKTTLTAKDTLVLAESAPVSHQVAGLDIDVRITAQDLLLEAAHVTAEAGGVSVATSADVQLASVVDGVTPIDMPVLDGKVYITYRALRQDLSEEITDLYNVNEVEGTLGKIDPLNPLGYAALKCLQNTITRVRVIGISSDDQVGYQAALDVASGVDTVYALVPLTQNPVICAAFSTHCQQFSTPDQGKWRICIVNQALVTTKTLTSTATPPVAKVIDDGSGDFRRVEDADGTFVSSGVMPTDTFTIAGEDYVVEEVINNNVLFLVEGPAAAISVAEDYSITRTYTKTAQAENLGLVAASFRSRRAYFVWPDLVGDGGKFVAGYYLCAAIAGMVAGFPAHKGFTNVGIVGFDDVGRSNRYFNEDQLNIMAEKGVYIVVQDAPGAIPYSRHQLSTDASIIEFREMSITKNIDFISYFFKRRLATFIGDWNITPATLLAISQFTQGLIDFLLSQSTEKIGAPLLAASITKLEQHPTLKDNVDMAIAITIPYPLNNLNVHLVI